MNSLTQQMLSEAGWYPGRSVQTDEYVTAFQKYGVRVPELVIRFLSEFGGLYIRIPEPEEPLEFRPPSFITEVQSRSLDIPLSRNQIQLDQPVPNWADVIHKEHSLDGPLRLFAKLSLPEVFHIGWTPSDDFDLWMDKSGVVYGSWEWSHIFRIGMSGQDALDNLINKRRTLKLYGI